MPQTKHIFQLLKIQGFRGEWQPCKMLFWTVSAPNAVQCQHEVLLQLLSGLTCLTKKSLSVWILVEYWSNSKLLASRSTNTYSLSSRSGSTCHERCVFIKTFDVCLECFNLLLKVIMTLQQILSLTQASAHVKTGWQIWQKYTIFINQGEPFGPTMLSDLKIVLLQLFNTQYC